ncbi:MAG TPA: chromosomal replication initiator protein DnaA [Bacteroidales bacterium]|jgi:chromosomal replication initiator protein|nr:chromosomal replication initiator protein DnaA [Bacteroidales bacterium]MDY0160278.1 chromosomal replication initiator protein DnaA [Bacteroidales bacterium]HXK82151.1 chromosomal replication initiator protein DnaA [Bacteroidales bacterium]
MPKSYVEVWSKCLQIIRDNVPKISFRTWFEPIVPIKLEESVLTLQVPSTFFYEFLEEQYLDLLRKTLQKVIGTNARLEYHVIMDNSSENRKPYTVKIPANDKSKLVNKPVQVPLDMEAGAIKNPFVIPGIKKLHVDPQLNPESNFKNFVEGECNRLARAAGYAVAENPGKTAFNPLFIYGASGLGKTHLSQAIGVEVKNRFPEKIVLYVNANKFVTQYMEATRNNNRNDFIHFYQMMDVLIVDDVHYFAKKEGTQEIFFQIFNHLHQMGKQLVLTSDKPPVELNGMEQRLLSRFKWGLSAELQEPDFETRIKILKTKTYKDGIEIAEEVLEYIASHITSSVRELEGALISLLAQATLNRKDITIGLAKDMIDKLVKSTKREISIDYIQKVVCNYFNMPVELIGSKTRKREIVQARQIAMYFAKHMTKASLASIGSSIGGKDHATVLHACKTVNNLMDTDKHFKTDVEEIEKRLKM